MMTRVFSLGMTALAGLAALGVGGCERAPRGASAPDRPSGAGSAAGQGASPVEPASAAHGHSHDHTAPRGGALVSLGDHVAHLEILLDVQTGVLDVYVLDGEAEGAIRVAHESLAAAVTELTYSDGRAAVVPFALDLVAVASALSGETVGDSSHLQGQHDALKGAAAFRARITEITVRGRSHQDVIVSWPAGDH